MERGIRFQDKMCSRLEQNTLFNHQCILYLGT